MWLKLKTKIVWKTFDITLHLSIELFRLYSKKRGSIGIEHHLNTTNQKDTFDDVFIGLSWQEAILFNGVFFHVKILKSPKANHNPPPLQK